MICTQCGTLRCAYVCAAIFGSCLTLTYAYKCNSFRMAYSLGWSPAIYRQNLESYTTLFQKHNLKNMKFAKTQFEHISAIDLPHDLHLLWNLAMHIPLYTSIFRGCLTLTYTYECNSFRMVYSSDRSPVTYKQKLQSYATLSEKHSRKTRKFAKTQFEHISVIDLPHDLHLLQHLAS